MSKILTAGMKRRATYESLVRDTILEPKDKIKLPNREATILRRTQQLSRYDDDDFLGLETLNEKINKERIQHLELLKLVAQKPDATMSLERARQLSGSDDDFKMYGEADIELENQIAKQEAILSEIQKSETDAYAKHKQLYLKQFERGTEDASIVAGHMNPSSTTQQEELATRILTKTLKGEFEFTNPVAIAGWNKDIKARSSSSKDVPKETVPTISSSAAADVEDTSVQLLLTPQEIIKAFKRTMDPKKKILSPDKIKEYQSLIDGYVDANDDKIKRNKAINNLRATFNRDHGILVPPRPYKKKIGKARAQSAGPTYKSDVED